MNLPDLSKLPAGTTRSDALLRPDPASRLQHIRDAFSARRPDHPARCPRAESHARTHWLLAHRGWVVGSVIGVVLLAVGAVLAVTYEPAVTIRAALPTILPSANALPARRRRDKPRRSDDRLPPRLKPIASHVMQPPKRSERRPRRGGATRRRERRQATAKAEADRVARDAAAKAERERLAREEAARQAEERRQATASGVKPMRRTCSRQSGARTPCPRRGGATSEEERGKPRGGAGTCSQGSRTTR